MDNTKGNTVLQISRQNPYTVNIILIYYQFLPQSYDSCSMEIVLFFLLVGFLKHIDLKIKFSIYWDI